MKSSLAFAVTLSCAANTSDMKIMRSSKSHLRIATHAWPRVALCRSYCFIELKKSVRFEGVE